MEPKAPMLREGALQGMVVVITGGGTGLGRAMAEQCLRLGARVAITSRKMEALARAAQEMGALGEVLPVACDVRDPAQVDAMRDAVLARWGRADALVNNAAGNFISPTERLSPNAFRAIIDIVLMGSVHCSLSFGKHWLARGERDRCMLNIVTTYAWTGSGYVVPSACAKAGVLALTRSLAAEWGPKGIRANAIAPGPFPTKGAWSRLLPGELMERFDMSGKVPLGRFGEPRELADLATYLLSPYSAYVNGEVVTIDGGEWLKGAGQFNLLEGIEPGMWDAIEQLVRGVKGS